RDDVACAGARLAEVVAQAEQVTRVLAREVEACDLAVLVLRVVHDDRITIRRCREVAVDRCRSQPVRAARLLDVALQPRLELLVDEPLPLLALRVLRAPVQPEERVAIDVAEQILDRQGLDVTRTEEGWI